MSGIIPFNRPALAGAELEHMRSAVAGGHSSAKGPYSTRVTDLLRTELGAADVLLTTSCTAALELSALLLDLRAGDTVIVPSFTFVTTALAFSREGAQLRFADIEPKTLGMDPASVQELMDDTVRAVVPVHYAGVACDIDALAAIVDAWPRAELVVDNAHGLFGRYNGAPLGSLGRFSTLSFHETKNFICGEGGALVINDPADVARAHILYDKGTNRRAFLDGEVDKYTWVDTGSSFGMSDLLAAFLFGQLEQRDRILAARRAVWERYHDRLAGPAADLGFDLPWIRPGCEQAFHMFYVVVPDRTLRDQVLKVLVAEGIRATFHYIPLHDSEGARSASADPSHCPVADDVSGRLIRLPFFNDISGDEVDRVCEVFVDAVGRFA